jgi:hypothetical protein
MRHIALTLSTLFAFAAIADEGMWVPQQLPEIAASLKKAGLALDPQQLTDLTGEPMGAVVSLGFCSAAFISPKGLIATNHHCAFGGLQLNSTPQKNLIELGFISKDMGEEINSGPNARIYVMDSVVDVTKEIRKGLTDRMTGLQRELQIEKNEKSIVAKCEKDKGFRCQIYSFLGGVEYRMFKELELIDIRVVYAPPLSVGNYGGEVDNWMWPRHTGDFSLIRAYVGKDGKPAAYSKDNVPYAPKHWLRVAKTPLSEGDFVMLAGYPGRTNRYALASEFENTQDWTYPYVGAHLKTLRDLVLSTGKNNPDIAIKYASTVKSWENVLKNYDGQLAGFKRSSADKTKRKIEKEVLDWLKGRGDEGKEALAAYEHLQALIALDKKTQKRDFIVGTFAGSGLLGSMRTLYRAAVERTKSDADRSPGFQDRDLTRLEGGVRELQNRYHPEMNKKIANYWLGEYVKLPSTERNAGLDAWLGGNDAAAISKAVDALHSGTTLGSLDERLKWLKASKSEFEKSSDPFIRLAVKLYPSLLEVENTNKARGGESEKYRPEFMKGVIAYKKSKGESVYPDANNSRRITYGNVMGYKPQDAVTYAPFTTAEGVAAKVTGAEPFDAPRILLEHIAQKNYGTYADKKLGTLPVNFLSTLDITGGNSGSSVMNANGELAGFAFDGNWESVSSNWVYDGSLNRMIAVDIRYVLWIIDKVFPAPNIIAEINS